VPYWLALKAEALRLAGRTSKAIKAINEAESEGLQAALNHLRATGAQVRKEDLARLSPLSHKHFNMLGHYNFAVPEEVLRGELRPLRVPEAADEELQVA
jgi:hypothetical protein